MEFSSSKKSNYSDIVCLPTATDEECYNVAVDKLCLLCNDFSLHSFCP